MYVCTLSVRNVCEMQQESVRPSLSTVDDLILQGRDIPIFLDKLSELELHAATGRTWLQKAAETFLIEPSHSLISVSVQDCYLWFLFKRPVLWSYRVQDRSGPRNWTFAGAGIFAATVPKFFIEWSTE